jgi:small GTP-binding protein
MLTMWDVGGQATKLWKHYFEKIDAILFVIDANAATLDPNGKPM